MPAGAGAELEHPHFFYSAKESKEILLQGLVLCLKSIISKLLSMS